MPTPDNLIAGIQNQDNFGT